jgi:hypothetical protein
MLPAYKTLLVIAEGKLILDNITILELFTPIFPLCMFTELFFLNLLPDFTANTVTSIIRI